MKRFKVVNGKIVVTWRGPPTYWNGELAPAVIVRVIVGESTAPAAWSKGLEGTEREAVKVTYNGQTFYLDNEKHGDQLAGAAWGKVTGGRGSPKYGHRSLTVEREVAP